NVAVAAGFEPVAHGGGRSEIDEDLWGGSEVEGDGDADGADAGDFAGVAGLDGVVGALDGAYKFELAGLAGKGDEAGGASGGGGAVFEFVAGEDADDGIDRGDDFFFEEFSEAGEAGGAGGFAAEAEACDEGAVFEDFVVGDFADDAVHEIEGAQGLGEVDGTA